MLAQVKEAEFCVEYHLACFGVKEVLFRLNAQYIGCCPRSSYEINVVIGLGVHILQAVILCQGLRY